MKNLTLIGLLFTGFLALELPAIAIPIPANRSFEIAQNQPRSSGGVLSKAQVASGLKKFQQKNLCKLKKGPSKTVNGLTQTLYACIGRKFQVIPGPATAFVIEKYPILIIQKGNQYKVKTGKAKIAKPQEIIRWTQEGSREFADRYTPDVRAKEVTARFNRLFIQQGKFNPPPLSQGTVNGLPVVCAALSGSCNDSNVLWTLRQGNQRSDIVAKLNGLLRGEAGSKPIIENDDDFGGTSVNMDALMTQMENNVLPELESSDDFSSLESSDNWDAINSDDQFGLGGLESNDDFGDENLENNDDFGGESLENNDDFGGSDFESNDDFGGEGLEMNDDSF